MVVASVPSHQWITAGSRCKISCTVAVCAWGVARLFSNSSDVSTKTRTGTYTMSAELNLTPDVRYRTKTAASGQIHEIATRTKVHVLFGRLNMQRLRDCRRRLDLDVGPNGRRRYCRIDQRSTKCIITQLFSGPLNGSIETSSIESPAVWSRYRTHHP